MTATKSGTQRVQVNVASLRLFLRSSRGPNRAFEPQSLGRVRDPVRIAEGPTAMDAATQRRHFGFRLRLGTGKRDRYDIVKLGSRADVGAIFTRARHFDFGPPFAGDPWDDRPTLGPNVSRFPSAIPAGQRGKREIRCQFIILAREIRCQFIILARKDELTPDYAPEREEPRQVRYGGASGGGGIPARGGLQVIRFR